LLAPGCSGKFRFVDDGHTLRYRHRELGYEIAYPSVLAEPDWSIVEVEQSDLFVRAGDGSAWALASNCRATRAGVETLAAELGRAIDGQPLAAGQRIRHAGLDGWAQRYARIESRRQIEIETVTLRGPRCTYDWILMTPSAARFEALEPRFEAWWQSFEPGPGERPEAVTQ
jgi:hypothetical protein